MKNIASRFSVLVVWILGAFLAGVFLHGAVPAAAQVLRGSRIVIPVTPENQAADITVPGMFIDGDTDTGITATGFPDELAIVSGQALIASSRRSYVFGRRGFVNASTTFALLGTSPNGTTIYCTDCDTVDPCAGAGTGAFADRENGVWTCASGGGAAGVGGSGTTNTIPKWTSATTLGDSSITDDGAVVAFTVTSPVANTDIYDFTLTVPITAAGQTTNIINIGAANSNHTGGTVNWLTGDAITGDPDAVENFITVPAGYDNPINLADPSYSFVRSIFMADGGIIEADGSGGGGSLAFQLGTTDNNSDYIFYNSNQNEMLFLHNVEPTGAQVTPLFDLRAPDRVALANGAKFVGFNWGISGVFEHAGNNEIIGLRMSGSTDTVATGTFERIFLESTGPWDTLVRWEGLTINDNETLIRLDDPTADRTITFPDASGTVGFEIAINQDLVAQAAQLGNPATNEIRFYVDESTNRTGGAGDDCVLVARLPSGTEIDVSILVTDGGC